MLLLLLLRERERGATTKSDLDLVLRFVSTLVRGVGLDGVHVDVPSRVLAWRGADGDEADGIMNASEGEWRRVIRLMRNVARALLDLFRLG